MAGINPEALLRRLASLPILHLGAGYTAGLVASLLLQALGQSRQSPGIFGILAWALGVLFLSMLFAVVTFYRDDDVFEASVLFTAMTGIGLMAAGSIVSVLLHGSIGEAVFTAATGFFKLLVRLVLLVPVCCAVIWAARKGRRFLAPGTVGTVDGA